MAKKNLFTQVELTKIKSNVFDLSHDVKLSFKMGELIPIMCTECVPGDKFQISCESLLRFAPLVAPVMHRMDVSMHYFFVPNRILWNHWEEFITNTEVAGSVPAAPVFAITGASPSTGTLLDYMGVPEVAGMTGTIYVNALPFAAFQSIYNEYYRDQNLVTEVQSTVVDGNNAINSNCNAMRTRAWGHDYFTAALPFAQKGDPVQIPIGSQRVVLDGSVTTGQEFKDASNHALPTTGAVTGTAVTGVLDVGGVESVLDPAGTLITEDSGQAANITDLRRAFKLQEWLERAARGGTRYIEFIKSMFGVFSSDKRLQRPEYITGVKTPVVISEVLNTTGTDDAPQGNMAGHGVSVTQGNYGSYFCEEHGWIIGIMSCIPQTAYQQGIPKKFLKTSPFDYYFEQFAHIGEQAIQNQELYIHSTVAERTETFGYIPRYAEYKFENNRVAGDFRSTLDFWHLGRQFSSLPALNQSFIECVPDTRIFAVEDGTDYLWAHVYNKVKAVRKMPFFGSPHF